MAKRSFHNTLGMSGRDLMLAETKARGQEEVVYTFFKVHWGQAYPPSRVHKLLVKAEKIKEMVPITSIRRAMTNLTKEGKLAMMENKVNGPLGKPEHTWKLIKVKTRNIPTQLKLL